MADKCENCKHFNGYGKTCSKNSSEEVTRDTRPCEYYG